MKKTRFYSKGPNSTLMDTQCIPQKMYSAGAFCFPNGGAWRWGSGALPLSCWAERLCWLCSLSPLGSLERRPTRVPQLRVVWAKFFVEELAQGCCDPGGDGSTTANLTQEPGGKCGLSSPMWIGRASHGSLLLLLLLFSDAWNFPLCFWCGTCSPWKFPN